MKKYNTSQRLKQIMEEKNLKQADILEKAKPFCKKYNVKLGRNDLSQYCSGKVEPRQDKLVVLANALGVTETWLMGYEVDTNKKEETGELLAGIMFDSDLLSAVEKLSNLQETDKKIVYSMIDSLYEKGQ